MIPKEGFVRAEEMCENRIRHMYDSQGHVYDSSGPIYDSFGHMYDSSGLDVQVSVPKTF